MLHYYFIMNLWLVIYKIQIQDNYDIQSESGKRYNQMKKRSLLITCLNIE